MIPTVTVILVIVVVNVIIIIPINLIITIDKATVFVAVIICCLRYWLLLLLLVVLLLLLLLPLPHYSYPYSCPTPTRAPPARSSVPNTPNSNTEHCNHEAGQNNSDCGADTRVTAVHRNNEAGTVKDKHCGNDNAATMGIVTRAQTEIRLALARKKGLC